MARLPKAVIVGLLTGLLGLVLSPFVHDLEENLGLNILFKLRGARKAPPGVIVVTTDEASAHHLNLPRDPGRWPRSIHARLIENLRRKGASVIALDIIFEEARSSQDDNLLAEAIGNARNVVLCEYLKKETIPLTDKRESYMGDLNIEKIVSPIPPLASFAIALAPFPLPKVPVKVSQYWTFKTSAGDKPTLPMVTFQVFGLGVYDEFIRLLRKISPSHAEKLPRDKNVIIATRSVETVTQVLRGIFERNPSIAERMIKALRDSGARFGDVKKHRILESLIRMYQSPDSLYLNFYGPPGTIPTIPYYRVLGGREKSALGQEDLDLHAKAVFVGLSDLLRPEQKDGFYTVFSSKSSGIDISGVEIAATAFANLLEDMPVRQLGFWAYFITMILWGMLLGIFCGLFPILIAALCVIGLSMFYLMAAQYQFQSAGIWHPLIIPLFFQLPLAFLGTVFWKHFDTHRERRNIRKAFRYYLPDKVVDQLAKNMADIGANSQVVYGTCLFTDAEQYTTLSEIMDPKELGSFMNKYYEAIFEPVRQHGGIVSNVVGDSMMAAWVSAHPDAASRIRACLASLDIAMAVRRFNQSSGNLALPTRIGLNSGQMLLGNIGAINHYEYRPVGDIVNTAARIEGLNKYLGTRILASEEVLDQLDGFLTRKLGEFILLGKSKPTVIYELICPIDESNGRQRSLCAVFAGALDAYRRKSWDEAVEIFRESLKVQKQDGPSLFYLKLCEEHKESPPEEMWNGLVFLDKK